jgi:hypothetical protein
MDVLQQMPRAKARGICLFGSFGGQASSCGRFANEDVFL